MPSCSLPGATVLEYENYDKLYALNVLYAIINR